METQNERRWAGVLLASVVAIALVVAASALTAPSAHANHNYAHYAELQYNVLRNAPWMCPYPGYPSPNPPPPTPPPTPTTTNVALIALASLSGAKEIPSVNTSATGHTVVFSQLNGASMRYALAFFGGTNLTSAHLHCGNEGENGPIVVTLFGSGAQATSLSSPVQQSGLVLYDSIASGDIESSAVQCTGTIGYQIANVATLASAIRNGDIYVNVHSLEFPNGLARGQLSAQTVSVPSGFNLSTLTQAQLEQILSRLGIDIRRYFGSTQATYPQVPLTPSTGGFNSYDELYDYYSNVQVDPYPATNFFDTSEDDFFLEDDFGTGGGDFTAPPPAIPSAKPDPSQYSDYGSYYDALYEYYNHVQVDPYGAPVD